MFYYKETIILLFFKFNKPRWVILRKINCKTGIKRTSESKLKTTNNKLQSTTMNAVVFYLNV